MILLPEKDCVEILRLIRWENGLKCVNCNSERVLKYGKDRKGFPRYICKDCKKSFNDKTGTLFEGSQISISEWFHILYNYDRKSLRKISIELKKPYNTIHACAKKIREDPLSTRIMDSIILEMDARKNACKKIAYDSTPCPDYTPIKDETVDCRVEIRDLKKPSVLMLGWEFYPKMVGGLGKVCYYLAKALVENGVRLTLMLPIDVRHEGMEIISTNLEKIEIGSILSPYLDERRYRSILLGRPERELYGADVFEEVERYTERCVGLSKGRNFDIIHAHDWMTYKAGMEIKKITGKPLVVHVHTTEFDRSGGLGVNQKVYDIEKLAFENADAIIAVSNYTKNKIIEKYGIPEHKIRVIHNALNYDEYTNGNRLKSGEQKTVLYFGRVTLQKGPDYFIRAAKKVAEHMNNVTFIVAGTGDMLPRMIELSCELGIGNKVLFTGYLSEEDAKRIYSMADVYVMPSVSEPFGIAALEAVASGVPLILTKSSGASEVINHCLKVDFWDVDEMANKIISCLNHEPLHKCLTENSIKEIRRLDWKSQALKCMEVYSRCIDAPK